MVLMANGILNQLYRLLFGENFSYDDFEKRLKMQKGIYLLQEMGVPVGDYRFSWYKHGPYSQSLLDDMYRTQATSDVNLSTDTNTAIAELRASLIVPSEVQYSVGEWAECIGSLHYLRENYFSFNTPDKDLLCELRKRKPHLCDDHANQIALNLEKKIF